MVKVRGEVQEFYVGDKVEVKKYDGGEHNTVELIGKVGEVVQVEYSNENYPVLVMFEGESGEFTEIFKEEELSLVSRDISHINVGDTVVVTNGNMGGYEKGHIGEVHRIENLNGVHFITLEEGGWSINSRVRLATEEEKEEYERKKNGEPEYNAGDYVLNHDWKDNKIFGVIESVVQDTSGRRTYRGKWYDTNGDMCTVMNCSRRAIYRKATNEETEEFKRILGRGEKDTEFPLVHEDASTLKEFLVRIGIENEYEACFDRNYISDEVWAEMYDYSREEGFAKSVAFYTNANVYELVLEFEDYAEEVDEFLKRKGFSITFDLLLDASEFLRQND